MMDTLIIKSEEQLADAAGLLRSGAMVAVPTETVYGLCVNGLDSEAVAALYEIKGRPEIKPLSLMVSSPEELDVFAHDVPPAARTLAARFWPGPLTIVLPARELIPEIVRAGGDTIGLRCPDHPMTLSLLQLAGIPLAGPSANPSGAPSPRTAEEVLAYFDGRIAAVVDGGACGLGRESTIIDLSQTPYRILRHGALCEDEIDDALVGGMTVIGLTGGTGSGKTTVLQYLTDRGALGLDCDAIYHELLETSEPMLAELRARFPGAFEKGSFDRKALGRIVFADEAALSDLNDITHRYVTIAIKRALRDHARAGGTSAVIDAIALVESGLGKLCTRTVAVTASPETRVRRIMAREGISEEYARSRIGAQKDETFFRDNCDIVLTNDGTVEELENKCREFFGEEIEIHT